MSFITSLPHIWGPQKVLLEDCLDVGQVGVITDQVGQVEALDHAEVDLYVTQITQVTHLKIARNSLAEINGTTHNPVCPCIGGNFVFKPIKLNRT